MKWQFLEMSRGQINVDPTAGEFFTPGGLPDSLVRESIQNSLDARHLNEQVRVRFHLSDENQALSTKDSSRYLEHLWPHLDAIEGGRENRPKRTSPMSFLTIEDFGTKGLNGCFDKEPLDGTYSQDKEECFTYFWRNIGRSNKQDNQRGRWGLGKTVFPASSLANTFFGLTVRSEDNRRLLMGQSVLKIHCIDSKKYCPYGFFAEHQADEFQKPIHDTSFIDVFRKDFCLSRGDEPGLSVIVPFPDREEINASHMLRSATIHYFYPIIRGELEIEVIGDGLHATLNSQTIDDVAGSIEWQDSGYSEVQMRNLFRFARRTLEFSETELLKIPQPTSTRSPDWNHGRFDDDVIEAIQDQFKTKHILAVRVPLVVRPKKGSDISTHFDMFVEHDPTLTSAEDHYIRQGITISEISTLRVKGYRGLVVVNDQALSTLLGDAENPSHTVWEEKEPKLKQRFEWGPYTVRFVRNALQRVVDKLLFVPDGRDDDLLKELFFVHDESDIDQEKARKKKKKNRTEIPQNDDSGDPPPSPPPPQARPFELQKIQGGFRLIREKSDRPLPSRIDIQVAYAVRKEKPFSKYDKNDFQLDKRPIKIETVGAPSCPQGNKLEVIPQAETFLIEVSGFDINRDLAVEALPVYEETSHAPEV